MYLKTYVVVLEVNGDVNTGTMLTFALLRVFLRKMLVDFRVCQRRSKEIYIYVCNLIYITREHCSLHSTTLRSFIN